MLIESSKWILRATPPSSLNYWPQTAYVSAMVQYECGSIFFIGYYSSICVFFVCLAYLAIGRDVLIAHRRRPPSLNCRLFLGF